MQSDEASESNKESSDEDLDFSGVPKNLSRSQKKRSKKRVNSRLEEAGARFPVDQFESNGSDSGTVASTSSRTHRQAKQVKSGAKVKTRAVVRTELWPHTIAIEDEGDEVSCDSIILSKFLRCYTSIMTNCRGSEAEGRSNLLHAVCSILEFLPWAEARTFHNLVMVKLEQGRIEWDANFTTLANEFMERKMKQSLKARVAAAGASNTNRQGYRNSGKSFGGPSYDNKFKISLICYQWNNGDCSYGEDCKKWHCCLSCAKRGKIGEPHKANTHAGSNTRGRSGGQRS